MGIRFEIRQDFLSARQLYLHHASENYIDSKRKQILKIHMPSERVFTSYFSMWIFQYITVIVFWEEITADFSTGKVLENFQPVRVSTRCLSRERRGRARPNLAARSPKHHEVGGGTRERNSDETIADKGSFAIRGIPHSGEGCGDTLRGFVRDRFPAKMGLQIVHEPAPINTS
jgi:hypothetical protein